MSANKPPPYESPIPSLGPILWSPRPGSQWFSALVTRADKDAISVIVFPEDAKGGSPKTGVLHHTNPRFRSLADPSQGVWDFTDDQKAVAALSSTKK